jgi:branched-chain amino acid transport system substrate-binding protein
MSLNLKKCFVLQIVAAFGATSSSGLLAAPTDVIVKIGHAAPLTGGASHLGKDDENGARLAIEEINAHGLVIGGKKITLELDSEDDAGDPRQATQVAQKLVDDKVVAVIGHLNSGTSIPASRIYSDAGIVEISPSATNPTYTQQGFKTTYRLVATDAQQGPALADYASKVLKARSVAIIDDSTAYGQGLANEFENRAKSAGMTVVSHDAATDKSIDFRAILTKLKGERPDVIMYGGMDSTGGPLAKQAAQLAMNTKILAGDGVCTPKVAGLAGEASKNIICSIAGMPLEKMEQGKAFESRYFARFNKQIEVYAPFTYDAVYIIVDAMKRVGSIEPANILAAMPSTAYAGVIGLTQFDSRGDLKQSTISLYEYVDGKQKLLDVLKM